MPSYPTGNRGGRAARAARQAPAPDRLPRDTPGRQPSPPRTRPSTPVRTPPWRPRPRPVPAPPRSPLPARWRIAPQPQFGRRLPFRRPSFGLASIAFDYADWYLQPPPNPAGGILPPGNYAGWFVRHGPNVYGSPYNAMPPTFWADGFTAIPTGPQTAVISGQAINPRFTSFARAVATAPLNPDWGLWIPNNNPAIDRFAQYICLVRPNPGGLPAAQGQAAIPRPVPAPFVVPARIPQIAPWAMPAQHFNIWPTRSPLWHWPSQPNENPFQPAIPGRNPAPRPARSPRVRPVPQPAPGIGPNPGGSPFPTPGGWVIPNEYALETVYTPNGRPQTRPGPAFHRLEPALPPYRESPKGKWQQAGWDLLNAFGGLTEGQDLIDSAWKAIPKTKRSKSFYRGQYVRPAFWRRGLDVWNNAGSIDPNQFARNLLANQMEDWYYGMQSQFWNPPRAGRRPTPNNDTRREVDQANRDAYGSPDFDQIVDEVFRQLDI